MSIAIVLDQGIPRDAAGRLRDLGYGCAHVGADEEILAYALERHAVVGPR